MIETEDYALIVGRQTLADGDKDIFILFLPPGSDTEINALQRGSTVVVQKSLREGFGLTVTEGAP